MKTILRKISNVNRLALTIALTVIAAPTLNDTLASTATSQDLNFKLVGTAVVEGHEGSVAVVEVGGRHQGLFREGQIVGSVRIKQILPDRIIVDTGDGEQIVKLLHYLRAESQRRQNATLSPHAIQPFVPRPSKSRSLQIVRLDQLAKESLLGDVDLALKEVSVDPVTVYGQPLGVRITPIKPGSIFSEIGLKQGDVILEVKDKEITDPKDAVALFKMIGQGGEFDIKVKGRRTRRIHMVVD